MGISILIQPALKKYQTSPLSIEEFNVKSKMWSENTEKNLTIKTVEENIICYISLSV